MFFYIALIGFNGVQFDILAILNNIANVGMIGFKWSCVEFGDIFAMLLL